MHERNTWRSSANIVWLNGYSGYSPPHHAPLRDALLRHTPQLFQPFRERADLYVIVRPEVEPDFVDWLETEQGIGRLPDVGDWRVYRLPREGSGPCRRRCRCHSPVRWRCGLWGNEHDGRPMALAALCYLLITALLFHNLLPVLTTHLFSDLGDPLLNASILEWNAKHLPLTTDWWNFPAFAPLPGVTAFTEHLLGAYPLTSPIIWISGNPILAYNALQLLTLPLNGLAVFVLVRELTGSSLGAFVGGLAFAFAPFTGEHASHIQMLMAFGMPLALYGLHRYLKNR
jgi:hypothetical protein